MKSVPEKISKKRAIEMLTHNDNNRLLRQSRVNKLAGAMRRGEWKLNGESIKFNCDGRLIDGQHRLQAVVESGVPINTYVVRGLPAEAFDSIDQVSPRTIADVFARNGEVYYATLAGAVRWIAVLQDGLNWKDAGYSPDQAKAALEANAGVRESVKTVAAAAMTSGIIPSSMATALHYLFAKKDKALADKFFEQLTSGEGLRKSDPVYYLRERLIRNQREQAKLGRNAVVAFTIKAWNATRSKKPVGLLKWTEGTLPEIK